MACSGRRERLCGRGDKRVCCRHQLGTYKFSNTVQAAGGGLGTNLLERVLQFIQFLLVSETCVHYKKKHWGPCVAGRDLVLHCRELWQELGREVLLRDVVGIVLGEAVASARKWTGPHFRMIIDGAVRIQDAATFVAADRLILQGTCFLACLERCVPAFVYRPWETDRLTVSLSLSRVAK